MLKSIIYRKSWHDNRIGFQKNYIDIRWGKSPQTVKYLEKYFANSKTKKLGFNNLEKSIQ